jgi:protein-tyrosine phosphatase
VPPPIRHVPPDRYRPHPLSVVVVCSGNICRSPIGEQLLRQALADAGLAAQVQVSSAGTGSWHAGQDADPRAAAALRRAGVPMDRHTAHEITPDEAERADLVLVAGRQHLAAVTAMVTDPDKVRLLRTFDPAADDAETPDPYFGTDADFDAVVAMTTTALPGVLAEIRSRL